MRLRFVISVAVVEIFVIDGDVLAVSDEVGFLFAGGVVSLGYSGDSFLFGLFIGVLLVCGVGVDCPDDVVLSVALHVRYY